MKIIGLDVGEKRIGVAVVDSSVKIAVPHSTISVDGTELDQIVKLMKDEKTSLVVVGFPRNSKGEKTAQTEIIRLFATTLQARGAKIKFQDESLTSVLAERRLKLRKKPYQKADIDREAATIILQDFIEAPLVLVKEVSKDTSVEPSDNPFSSDVSPAKTATSIPDATDGFAQGAVPPARQRMTSPAETGAEEKAVDVGERKLSRKAPIISITILILTALFSLTALSLVSETRPVAQNPLRHPLTIAPGDSTSTIAQNLEKEGLIRNQLAFFLAAKLKNTNLPAGTHFLAENQSTWQIIETLSN